MATSRLTFSARRGRWCHYLAYKGQGVLVFAGAAGGEIAEISRTKSYTPDVLTQVVHNPKDTGKF